MPPTSPITPIAAAAAMPRGRLLRRRGAAECVRLMDSSLLSEVEVDLLRGWITRAKRGMYPWIHIVQIQRFFGIDATLRR